MDIFKFLKKEKQLKFPEKKRLEVPSVPPLKSLPKFPEKEVTARIKEAVAKPKKQQKQIFSPEDTLAAIEEAAVTAQKHLLGKREHLELTRPLFVDVLLFREVIDEIASISGRLKESHDSLSRLEEFREDEEKEFKRWRSNVQDIQKKLIYVDKTLFR